MTQAQLAERIGVGQRQISKVERGGIDCANIGTIRTCLEAVGGELASASIDEQVRAVLVAMGSIGTAET